VTLAASRPNKARLRTKDKLISNPPISVRNRMVRQTAMHRTGAY
jgi:hypothetical protein